MQRIGILALQGCVEPHLKHFESLGPEVELVPVKRTNDFKNLSGLVLPGGESTTMLKLISHYETWATLKSTATKIPYWGICAGGILMAKKVLHPAQESLAVMNITVERNGYGRQLDSHEHPIAGYSVAFIRAPVIKSYGKVCRVLAAHRGQPVWIQEKTHMVTTFHAELNKKYPSPFHKYFLDLCRANEKTKNKTLDKP